MKHLMDYRKNIFCIRHLNAGLVFVLAYWFSFFLLRVERIAYTQHS